MCAPWELNPQPFALLTQCSTTEPQEHKLDHQHLQVGDSVLVLLPVPGASLQVGVGDMEKYNITICFRNITILSWFFVMLVLLFCKFYRVFWTWSSIFI